MNSDYIAQRLAMVEMQLKSRGIKDKKVLKAMSEVPRDIFVPEDEKRSSYYDGPLSIGFGQTISQPYIVAYMTEILNLTEKDRVLEIGTGSGYQTAILAEIAKHVFTIEVVEELSKKAREMLIGRLNYSNISFKIGNGKEGWPEHAPFDRIIITAAPEKFPEKLFSQLGNNGIAVAPIGNYFQRLIQFKKKKDKIVEKPLIGVSFVPFI
jgi:protein-L-isoaspartate(D-aspartate) O-methyltransferase